MIKRIPFITGTNCAQTFQLHPPSNDSTADMEVQSKGGEDDRKWVHDSSLDFNGRIPLRASTGSWKASLLIISIEFSERLSYFGIATNLITYLTEVLRQELGAAAQHSNYWSGATLVTPLLGGFLADAYTGRYSMVFISSAFYILGLGLLTMSHYIPDLKPPRRVHEPLFFVAMYLVSLGTGGYKPCLQSFGADQFDDGHDVERKQKMSFFNWWNVSLCCGLFLGVTVVVYMQDNVNWGLPCLILTVIMAVSVVIFFAGRRRYRYLNPHGSPLTPMAQVLVAAIRKRNAPYPSSPSLLYELSKTSGCRFLCHTRSLRFLDRAAIVVEGEDLRNRWRLATVTQVEELKLVLHIVPIWLLTLMFGVTVAQASTFFVKQAATMDRKLGSFELPPASVYALSAVGMMVSVTLYERYLVRLTRRLTGNERGIDILHRIGVGLTFSVAAMVVAALVENKRRQTPNPVRRMSVFWLAPQYVILGFGDGFTLVGLQEYFYEQVPDSMRSLGIAFYLSVIGVGSFACNLLITVVDRTTKGRGWIGASLEESRLDRFYWLLAVLNALNFCVFVAVARRHTYKNVQAAGGGVNAVANCHDDDDDDEAAAAGARSIVV